MIDYSHYPPLVAREDLPGSGDGFTDTQLAQACDDVRGACGWHIAPIYTETFHLDSDGATVLTLPSLHITEPSSVTDRDGNAITDYQWSELGQLVRAQGWPAGFRAVTVVVEHGLPSAPPAIAAVVDDMLAERAASTPGRGPLKGVSHDGASFQFGGTDTKASQQDPASTYAHVLRRFQL